MYKLCWKPNSWNTPEMLRGITHSARFDTLEELKKTLSKCSYGGEWVEDNKGNRVYIDLMKICLSSN